MMIEINFKFQGKDNVIQSNTTRLFKDVCEEFAKKAKVDLDYLIFIYNGETINLEMEYYVGQQFNSEFESDNKRVDILVYQKKPISVEFIYQQISYVIGAKETEKMKDIFEKFEKKANIRLKDIFMAYNGKNISDEEGKEKTLAQVINKVDRKREGMCISVYDLERNSIKSEDNIKIYNPEPQNDDNVNDNNPNVPLINEVDNIDNDNNSNTHSINEVQEVNSENNSRNENSNCFFKILENLRPVYIILIQIGIITLFMKVIASVFLGIGAIMCIPLVIIYRFLKREFESKWWYIYYIIYIPLIIIIDYLVASVHVIVHGTDYKFLLVCLLIRAFDLIPVIILKGSKIKLFILLILISTVIIAVPFAIFWENKATTLFLSFFSGCYVVYLGYVYYYSHGLFSFYNDKMSVLMYDYGFFSFIVYGFMMIFYPLYWFSKKCVEFFKND